MAEYTEHYGMPLRPELKDVLTRIVRERDHVQFPPNDGVGEYELYKKWLAEGGKPDVVSDHVEVTLEERRQAEYVKQGASTDALIVALWEQIVEDRPESAAALQAIRAKVKLDIPKGA